MILSTTRRKAVGHDVCALLVEREHGDNAAIYIAERIGALALNGDAAGVARWKAIAEKLSLLSLLWTGETPLTM